jgi:hypothetical protein
MKEKLSTLLDVLVYEKSKEIAENFLNKPFNFENLENAKSYFKNNGIEFYNSSVIYSLDRKITEGFAFFYKEEQYRRMLTIDSKKGVVLSLW